MSEDDDTLKIQGRKLKKPKTLWLEEEDGDIWDFLYNHRKVRVAEHLRRVVKPELHRLYEIEKSKQEAEAS